MTPTEATQVSQHATQQLIAEALERGRRQGFELAAARTPSIPQRKDTAS